MIDIGADLQRAFDEGYEKGKADRPQGRWIYDRYDSRGVNRCSECGAEIKGYGENIPFPNCPYCLARMKGADDDR